MPAREVREPLDPSDHAWMVHYTTDHPADRMAWAIHSDAHDNMTIRAIAASVGEIVAWYIANVDPTYTGGPWPIDWELLASEAAFDPDGDES